MSERLYFIALVPPSPAFEEMEEIRQQVALDYHVSHALNAPAHLTLMPPFMFQEDRVHLLKNSLRDVAQNFRPFSVVLQGYGFFEPRVLFFHVLQNRSLRHLEDRLWEKLQTSFPALVLKPRQRFHPHITVAMKMDESTFFKMQKEFTSKPFHTSFPIHDLVLLEWDQDRWYIKMRLPLRGAPKRKTTDVSV